MVLLRPAFGRRPHNLDEYDAINPMQHAYVRRRMMTMIMTTMMDDDDSNDGDNDDDVFARSGTVTYDTRWHEIYKYDDDDDNDHDDDDSDVDDDDDNNEAISKFFR